MTFLMLMSRQKQPKALAANCFQAKVLNSVILYVPSRCAAPWGSLARPGGEGTVLLENYGGPSHE